MFWKRKHIQLLQNNNLIYGIVLRVDCRLAGATQNNVGAFANLLIPLVGASVRASVYDSALFELYARESQLALTAQFSLCPHFSDFASDSVTVIGLLGTSSGTQWVNLLYWVPTDRVLLRFCVTVPDA